MRKVLETGKVTRWRIHFLNGPGLRNGQLGGYEPHAGMTIQSYNALWEKGGGKLARHLRDRVQLYCHLFASYPSLSLEISPTLEHNLSSKAFKRQALITRRNCPRAVIVNNPVTGVAASGGFTVERHGAKVAGLRAPCNVSLDGDEAFDANVPAFLAQNPRCTKYIWSLTYNGRLGKGAFVDPRKRTRWPTREQLRTLLGYARPLPYSPLVEGCFPVTRPRLWKVSADDHGGGDVRANKPLWISPARELFVDVVTAVGGKAVGSMVYFGAFDGGGYRYYSGTGSNLYGVEMAERAVRLSGSPYVLIREPGGQCFGPLHPAYRWGYFRD